MKLKDIFKPYNRKSDAVKDEAKHLPSGRMGRDSLIDPRDRYARRISNIIEPDEHQQFRLRQAPTYQELLAMTASQAIERLIQSSEPMSFAVNTYVDHTVVSYEIVGEEPGRTYIEDFINSATRYRDSYLTLLKRVVYGIYVEGAYCTELSFGETGEFADRIDYVSPLSLSFEKVEDGQYYRIGQKDQHGNLNPVLQDESDPNPYFIYQPVNVRGTKPYGSSNVAPSIFSVVSLADLFKMVVEYTQGQVMPDMIVQVMTTELVAKGFQPDDAAKIASDTRDELEKAFDGKDVSQNIDFVSVPIAATMVSSLSEANISGVEMISNLLDRSIQRGLRIPRTLYGGQIRGNSLADNSHEYELIDFAGRTSNIKTLTEVGQSIHYADILSNDGISGTAELAIKSNDSLLNRVNAEILGLQADAFTKVKGLDIYNRKQLHEKFGQVATIFADSDLELPDEFERPTETQPTNGATNE